MSHYLVADRLRQLVRHKRLVVLVAGGGGEARLDERHFVRAAAHKRLHLQLMRCAGASNVVYGRCRRRGRERHARCGVACPRRRRRWCCAWRGVQRRQLPAYVAVLGGVHALHRCRRRRCQRRLLAADGRRRPLVAYEWRLRQRDDDDDAASSRRRVVGRLALLLLTRSRLDCVSGGREELGHVRGRRRPVGELGVEEAREAIATLVLVHLLALVEVKKRVVGGASQDEMVVEVEKAAECVACK